MADETQREIQDLRVRGRAALDLLGQGHGIAEVMTRCAFKTESAARHALERARKEIAHDIAEEQRLNFMASYGPVRIALHKLARKGETRAVHALVALDERQCRLLGLDLAPSDPLAAVHYTKRIIIEEAAPQHQTALPAPTAGDQMDEAIHRLLKESE